MSASSALDRTRDDAASRRSAITLTLIAMLFFASQDALTRLLVREYPVAQVVMVRHWLVLAAVVVVMAWRGVLNAALRPSRPLLQCLRGALLCGEIVLFAIALQSMGLADIHALQALFPVFATVLAALLLGERFGWRRAAAVVCGFGGALIVIRPGLGVFGPAAWLALLAAFGFALYNVLTRLAMRRDGFETCFLWAILVGTALSTPWGIAAWRAMDAAGWFWTAMLALAALVAHGLLIKALQLAPASLLQPLNFSVLVWALLIGYGAFGELPDVWTMTGALVIVASGLYVIRRNAGTG